jgi:hypothetical protein
MDKCLLRCCNNLQCLVLFQVFHDFQSHSSVTTHFRKPMNGFKVAERGPYKIKFWKLKQTLQNITLWFQYPARSIASFYVYFCFLTFVYRLTHFMRISFNKRLSQHIFHSVTLGGNPFGLGVYRRQFWNPIIMSHKLLYPWWVLSAAVVSLVSGVGAARSGDSHTLPSWTYQANQVFQNEQTATCIRRHCNTYIGFYFCHAKTKKSNSISWCQILWDNIKTIKSLSFDAFLGIVYSKEISLTAVTRQETS